MANLIASINLTIDGFCDYASTIADEQLHELHSKLVEQAGTVMFGRKTFKLFEQFWADEANLSDSMQKLSVAINEKPKFVFSTSLEKPVWKSTTIIRDISSAEINELKKQAHGNILLLGSPGIFAELTLRSLIDEYYISVQPIMAGQGKRLFDSIALTKNKKLTLIESTPFRSGAVIFHYSTQVSCSSFNKK